MVPDQSSTRRTVLKATGVTLVGGSLAGCVTSGRTPSDDETTEADTRTTTATDATVTVAVGPDGALAFEPADLTVRPGTTVRWEWESDDHNVVVESQPEEADWAGTPGPTSKLYDAGYSYEHTFTTTGTFEYYCKPHRAAGMVGDVTVTENPAATTTTEERVETTTTTEETTSGDGVTEMLDARGQSEVTVEVGPNGRLAFDPETVRISPDTTVTWVWQSDNHNVVPESQPDGAGWQGTEGSSSSTYDSGHTYAHTFEAEGTYEYFCYAHRTAGMTGSLIVE